MFCPQCSQQQVSSEVRFCSRCGFPLDGVAQLLASGGLPHAPAIPEEWEYGPPSPRLKGVRQGIMLWMAALVLLPLLIVLVEEFHVLPEGGAMLGVMLPMMAGFVRIVYALLFEDGPLRRRKRPVGPAKAAAVQLPETWAQQQREQAALPPGQSIPAGYYAPPRAHTSEIVKPPASVTENTTRLLDEEQGRG
jgi:hypothetical protein